MIIRDTNYESGNFTTIHNYLLRDMSISLTARGLMGYMLSCSNEWKFSIENLCKNTNTKQTKLLTALKELEAAGYIKKEKLRDSLGKIMGYEWTISEKPTFKDGFYDF